jgi:O-ureido-D-serine cyclo-ligase
MSVVPRVALATASSLVKADFDEPPLRAALAAAGVEATVLAWDDPSAQEGFAAVRACVIRSTWNYIGNLEPFLAWIDRCAAVTRLWNPAPVVRWNCHKRYLVELAAQGLPVVPTRFVPRGSAEALADLVPDWPALVIKPAVSAGSFGTLCVARDADGLARGEAHLRALVADRDMLVQRYEPSVEGYGERALIWIDGAFTHAVRKGRRWAGERENVSEAAVPIADDERAAAERVLAAAPGPLLYARVDLVRDPDGRPQLMELELIEPSLFFGRHPPAADRLAAAIARRCA